MSKPIELRIWRMVSGVRTPYVLTLDSSRLVIDERVDSDGLAAVLRDMKQPVLVGPEAVAKTTTLSMWFDADAPNPIPGTDKIRGECLAKLASAADQNCTNCELSAIKTEYRVLLENAKLV